MVIYLEIVYFNITNLHKLLFTFTQQEGIVKKYLLEYCQIYRIYSILISIVGTSVERKHVFPVLNVRQTEM